MDSDSHESELPDEKNEQKWGFPRAKTIALNGLVALVSTILMLCAVEIGARIFFGEETMRAGVMEEHATNFYAPKPSTKGHLYFKDTQDSLIPIPCTISSQGFRDREIPAKQENELRILMVGDSFTMGYGLSSAEAIPQQLELILSDRVEGSRIVSVVNGGVLGYSPWQERAFMNERGFPIQPDIVILQLFPENDVDGSLEQDEKYLQAYNEGWKRNLREWKHQKSWPSRAEVWMREHSGAYAVLLKPDRGTFYISDFLRPFSRGDPLPSFPTSLRRPFYIEANLKAEYPLLKEGWRLYERDIVGMSADCAEKGIEFLAYTVPARQEVTQERWDQALAGVEQPDLYERGKLVRRTKEICNANSIPYIDVAEAILSFQSPVELYFKFNGHLNEDGATFTADRVAEHLIASASLNLSSPVDPD